MNADDDSQEAGRPFAAPTPATLATCDDEPIHIPGAIQPHGCLFEVSGDALTVVSVSSNLRRRLGLAAAQVLGQPLAAALGDDIADAIRQNLANLPPATIRALDDSATPNRRGVVLFHHYVGRTIVEWIADAEHRFPTPTRIDQLLAATLTEAAAAVDIQAAMDRIAEGVKATTGYDGVMVYRFHPDWHGEVVAEQNQPGLASYRGLHYPASDIPSQARRLYVETRARVIADVYALDAVLMEAPGTAPAPPLDLSHAFTRSVSPVHIQYLRNMGSGATLVTSLVIGGKLWGLIACHHRSAYSVPWYAFERMRRFTDDAAAVLRDHLTRSQRLRALTRDGRLAAVTASLAHSIPDALQQIAGSLGADGLIAYVGGRIWTQGVLPADAALIPGAVLGQPDDAGAIDSMSARFAQLRGDADGAGIAWMVLSRPYQAVLVLVRREFQTTVSWSGNPEKAIVRDPVTQRLSPRGSFDLWKQTISGHSRPWDADTVDMLEFFRERVDIGEWARHVAAAGSPLTPDGGA